MVKKVDDESMNPSTMKMVEELNVVRFRMTRRSVAGYEVADVDAFLDTLLLQAQSGKSVLPMLRKKNFRMSPHRNGSYVTSDVDAFLERMESFAKGDASAFDGTDSQNPTGNAKWPLVAGFVLAAVLLVLIVVFSVFGP